MRQSHRIIHKASRIAHKRTTLPSSAPSSLRRAASTLSPDAITIPAIFDIFDAPARLVDDEADSYLPENFRSPKPYIPSPFCPPASLPSSSNAVPSASPVASSSKSLSFTPPMILFDGPAHPTRPLIVTSRHRRASSLALGASCEAYSPPEPIIFDGPSRPRRRGPTPMSKSEAGSMTRVLAAATTALAGAISYQLFSQRQATAKASALRKHIMQIS